MTTITAPKTIAQVTAALAAVSAEERALFSRTLADTIALKVRAGSLLFTGLSIVEKGNKAAAPVKGEASFAEACKALGIVKDDPATHQDRYGRSFSTLAEDFRAFTASDYLAEAQRIVENGKEALNARNIITVAGRLVNGKDANVSRSNNAPSDKARTKLAVFNYARGGKVSKADAAAATLVEESFPVDVDALRKLDDQTLRLMRDAIDGILAGRKAGTQEQVTAQATNSETKAAAIPKRTKATAKAA